MLVLTRRVGERLLITTPGGVVLAISIGRINTQKNPGVRIAIDAPREFRIVREELGEKKERISS
jgi:carbon storage regulator CsrA